MSITCVHMGDIHIASNVVISAVVVRSIEAENTTWAGVTEKKIKK